MADHVNMPADVLVTGGAGFIGRHLVRHLINKGHRVSVLDNFSTGSRQPIKGATVFEGDVIDYDFTRFGVNFNRIFHLASPAAPTYYLERPLETWDSIVSGTRRIAGYAAQTGAALLFASTSEVYGRTNQSPQHEKMAGEIYTTEGRACYQEAKRAAEVCLNSLQAARGLQFCTLRIFNCYGPGMLPTDGRVMNRFFQQALAGNALTVYGDGGQSRSFCHIEDFCRAVLLIDDRLLYQGQTWNIGNDESITIKMLAEKIIQLCASDSYIDCIAEPVPEIRHRRPDVSALQSALDWKSEVSLDEGLSDLLKTFNHLKGEKQPASPSLLNSFDSLQP